MYVVTVDGFVRRAEYKGLESLQEAVGGYIEPVSTLPLDSGYSCYVNEEGLLDSLQQNILLECLMGYQPLVGNGVLVSFAEGGENELLSEIKQQRFDAITEHLEKMVVECESSGEPLAVGNGPIVVVNVLADRPLYARGG